MTTVRTSDQEEVARFVAPRSWLERLDMECLRWGVPRSKVIMDAVTRYALGPKGLRKLYASETRGGFSIDRGNANERRGSILG